MKQAYITKAFYGVALSIIEQANAIIADYARQGYGLTLRQLYYQFIARDLFPDAWKQGGTTNNEKSYAKLGKIISDAPRAGLIDWDAIADRTRFLREPSHWSSPNDILQTVAKQFRINPWENQPYYVEVWFEKDALLAIFERAAEDLRLPIFSNRGYVSDSSVWEAAQRIRGRSDADSSTRKEAVVLHFGDHDPSGIDMTRDIEERLNLFGANVEIKRMALNMAQVRQYNPPPNPAKQTDSRYADYRQQFGVSSWELDALDPDVLVRLVRTQVNKYLDKGRWEHDLKLETQLRAELGLVARADWPKLMKILAMKKYRKIIRASHDE